MWSSIIIAIIRGFHWKCWPSITGWCSSVMGQCTVVRAYIHLCTVTVCEFEWCVCVCVCVCVWVFVWMCLSVHVYVCVHVCVCVRYQSVTGFLLMIAHNLLLLPPVKSSRATSATSVFHKLPGICPYFFLKFPSYWNCVYMLNSESVTNILPIYLFIGIQIKLVCETVWVS